MSQDLGKYIHGGTTLPNQIPEEERKYAEIPTTLLPVYNQWGGIQKLVPIKTHTTRQAHNMLNGVDNNPIKKKYQGERFSSGTAKENGN
jgi:hypothetical protein